MFPSFILALREGLEAALIIGIVLGVLKKIKKTQFAKDVWLGTGTAAALSLITALVINTVGASFEGKTEQVFEGLVMLTAAGVLTWMIFWMQRQSKSIKTELELDVRRAASGQSGRALFILAFLAVLREGIELALFLSAAAASSSSQSVLLGGILGLMVSAALGWILFASTIRLNLHRFFQVTGLLLIFFAAGLVAYGVHELNEAGWIPAVVEHVWDTNNIINENSTVGLILKGLFGYNGNPSLTEVAAYLVYFLAIFLGLKRTTTRALNIPQEA